MLDDFEVGGDGVFHRTYLNWSRQMKNEPRVTFPTWLHNAWSCASQS